MEEKENSNQPETVSKRPRIDRSDLLSILAVIVSLSALGVSMYEAGILREQSAMMQNQQRASVWPYLEVAGSYMYNENAEVTYSFKNKGVGPAKIKSVDIFINGKQFSDYDEIKSFFKGLFPDSKSLTVVLTGLGGVLAAEEQVEVFHLLVEEYPGAYEIVRELEFKYEICYCSIYDDCWYLDSNADKPVPNCL